AAPSAVAPETTARSAAPEAASPVSRSHGPGTPLGTTLLQLSSQVAERPGACHVRHVLREVLRWRWGRRVPLERVGAPPIVADARARPRRFDHVQDKHHPAEAHEAGPDGGDRFVPPQEPAVVVGVDTPRHAEEAKEVLDEEGEVEAGEHEPEAELAEPL